MSKTKYYAVRIGKKPGVYETWSDCQEQTKGFSGSQYKKFNSKMEAEQYVIRDFDEDTGEIIEGTLVEVDYDLEMNNDLTNGYVVAFTDGSHDSESGNASYGVHIITPEFGEIPSRVEEISSRVYTDKYSQSRNIVGEVFGVINALEWALKNEFSKVSIYCDYQGLLKWADSSWNANSDIAKFYVKKVNDFKVMLDIKFVWVKGHSNVHGNEQADILAKGALRGKRQIFKTGGNYFTGAVTNEQELDFLKNQLSDSISTEENPVSREKSFSDYQTKETFIWKKEKLHITYYKSKRNFLVQGAPGYLYSMLLSMYSESLETYNMIQTFRDAYESTIKEETVDEKFDNLGLPANYPESFKILIKQSISALSVKNKSEFDYGHYTVSAYRALEGHMRYLSEEAGFHIDAKFNFGGNFKVDSNGNYQLSNLTLKNHELGNKIEECYNLYYSRRHPLLHTGEIGIIDETELVPTLKEAQSRIEEVLSVIKY